MFHIVLWNMCACLEEYGYSIALLPAYSVVYGTWNSAASLFLDSLVARHAGSGFLVPGS